MVLPAPPPRPAALMAPPDPLTTATRHIVEAEDLPFVGPVAHPARRASVAAGVRALERAARLGLVLAIVVALAGVGGAVVKSGDDGVTHLAGRGASAVADEEPADEDPLAVPSDGPPATAAAADPYLVPDGYQVVQGDGVFLSVPASWETLSAQTLDRMFDDETLDEIYPDLDPDLRAAMLAAVDQGAIFMAIDPDPAGQGRNLNIVSMPGEVRLDEMGDQAERELRRAGLGIEVRSRREVDTPIGRALRLAYSAEVAGHPFDAVQYYVPVDGTTYIVTGTAADDVTDAAVQTLRLGDAPEPT